MNFQFQAKRADLVLINNERTWYLIDFAVSADNRVKIKKQLDKCFEPGRTWKCCISCWWSWKGPEDPEKWDPAIWKSKDEKTPLILNGSKIIQNIIKQSIRINLSLLICLLKMTSENLSRNLAQVNLIESLVKLTTVVESDQKAPFSIATTLRGERYSFLWIAPLYPWNVPYIAEC